MAGVMRPVGPESAETYWMRRALVVGAFLVLLIILLIVLFNLGGSPGQAAPAPTQTGIPVSSPTSASPTATPSSTTPAGTPSASGSTPSGSSSVSGSPSPSGSTSQSPAGTSASPSSTSASPSGTTSKSPSGKPGDKASSDKTSSHKASSKAPVTACAGADLKASVKSKKHTVKAGSKVVFDVSYANSSDQSCSLSVSPKTYQLTIYSGSDRIWSTADCAKLVHSATVTLKPGHAVGWSVTWNGKRSQQGATCQNRPETPQAGYYHAMSQLKGTTTQDYLLVLS